MADSSEHCVLVLMPTGRDAVMTRDILARSGMLARVCGSVDELCDEILAGAGAVLLTFESLVTAEANRRLFEILDNQASWSDLPILLFTTREQNTEAVWAKLGARANIT